MGNILFIQKVYEMNMYYLKNRNKILRNHHTDYEVNYSW